MATYPLAVYSVSESEKEAVDSRKAQFEDKHGAFTWDDEKSVTGGDGNETNTGFELFYKSSDARDPIVQYSNEWEGSTCFGDESDSEDLKDSAEFVLRSREPQSNGTFALDHVASPDELNWHPGTEEDFCYEDIEYLSPDDVYKLQSDLEDDLLSGFGRLTLAEEPLYPIVIPGPDGTGWKGKETAFEEYAADEALYGYRGTQVTTLNAGRNRSGGGDDPNDENSHNNGRREEGGGDRGGRNGGGPSGGGNQEVPQRQRNYLGGDLANTSTALNVAGRGTPAPAWNSGSDYSWACVSDVPSSLCDFLCLFRPSATVRCQQV